VSTPGLATDAPSAAAPSERAHPPSLPVRFLDVAAAEWTKLRSIRSNFWTLLAACVLTIGGTVLIASTLSAVPHSPFSGPFTALTASYVAYAEYSVLPVGVLGVLVFTSEYSTGRIRTTMTAVPQRRILLAAKAAVAGTLALVLGELLAFGLFALTQAILSGHRGLSVTRPGVPGAVLAAGAVLAVSALLGVGLGAIIRHTAGAIAAWVAVLLLLAALCLALPAPWNDRIGKFTLAFAAYQVTALHPAASLLSPTWSMLVLLAWPAVTLGLGAILITRRDA
jgi:ABC-2 type transport system permease protein